MQLLTFLEGVGDINSLVNNVTVDISGGGEGDINSLVNNVTVDISGGGGGYK